MASFASLRNICVAKICDFLKNGTWVNSEENPFSCMPSSLVQELLSLMLPEELILNRASIAHSRLLLTSGKLVHFELPRPEYMTDYVTLLRMLSLGCKNLRRLSLLKGYRGERNFSAEIALQELIRNCVKLECLHSGIYFEPNDLGNCRNLKSLRLHFEIEEASKFLRGITSKLLKRFESIEVFAFCLRDRFLRYYNGVSVVRETVSILNNCPHLTSLGFFDSLMALNALHDRDLRTLGAPRRFQLRRCYWEAGTKISQFEYPDTIRVATLSCPLLEVLILKVPYAGGLQHLKTLQNLTCLDLHFYNECKYDCWQEFYSLLDDIGTQLRHLFVSGSHLNAVPLCLSRLPDSFPNLRTLKLECEMTVDEPVRSSLHFPLLERLWVASCDRKCQLFLLSDCLHLKVLSLQAWSTLTDDVLQTIHRKNSFAELETALINTGTMSELGLTRFIRSATKLRKLFLISTSTRHMILVDHNFVQLVRDLNPSIVCHFISNWSAHVGGYFPDYSTCLL